MWDDIDQGGWAPPPPAPQNPPVIGGTTVTATRPWWQDLVIGGLGLLGDFAGARYSARQARDASREQRDWEERMSNTAIQRRAADLEAAGFNRIMSVNSGGATTPQSAAPPVADLSQIGSRTAERFMASRMNSAMVAKVHSETSLNRALAGQAAQTTLTSAAQAGLIDKQAAQVAVATQGQQIENALKGMSLEVQKATLLSAIEKISSEQKLDARVAKDTYRMWSELEGTYPWIKTILPMLQVALGLLRQGARAQGD